MCKIVNIMLKFLVLTSFRISFILAHYDPAYFRSSKDAFVTHMDWMKDIRDDVMLSELALPGTHDSASFIWNNDIIDTQTLNFNEQLNYGIRVFDIRYRHTTDTFALYHGIAYLSKMFGDFLESVHNFLLEHSSETVLFRLKEELYPNNNNNRSAREILNEYLVKYKQTYLKTTENIELGEARGKFIILYNNLDFYDYGINYSICNIQDSYIFTSNWDLYNKWEKIRAHLDKARINGNKSEFYINYLSGAVGSLPYFVASGHNSRWTTASRLATGLTTSLWPHIYPDFPRVNCFMDICTIAFEGTNILTRDYIKNIQSSNRTIGIIMADFPGSSLIHEIIHNNYALNKKS
ncbi:uncharacterized protein LOC116340289 [Contarinia nasturtii]|uniref:uncharacterized protein LOC116340289 n=1 Tax=Contarinia nasturtii TaxID=265458 RepID=UPI0012D40D89|nr:uncharacterized protein LOC116340289 [Contarinia nasturtii]